MPHHGDGARRTPAWEIDPDLRLYLRLAVGRGAQLAATAVLAAIVLAAFVAAFVWGRTNGTFVTVSAFMFLPAAVFLLSYGASRAPMGLIAMERSGLLDHLRLCGRRPASMLAACLAGSTAPYVAVGAAALAADLWTNGRLLAPLAGALACAGGLDLALIVYVTVPPAAAPDARLGSAAVAFVTSALTLMLLAAADDGHPRAAAMAGAAAAVVIVVLPLALWLACRRLRRAPAARRGGRRAARRFWLRALPGDRLPEFVRQLRTGLRSAGTFWFMLLLPLTVLLVSALGPPRRAEPIAILLTLAVYAVPVIGAVAASTAARREADAGTLDLVTLTPQRAGVIAAAWYVALALPTWLTLAVTRGVLAIVPPPPMPWAGPRPWWLAPFHSPLPAALSLLLPAVGLVEGLSRRRASVYLWCPAIAIGVMSAYAVGQEEYIRRIPQSTVWQRHDDDWTRIWNKRPKGNQRPSFAWTEEMTALNAAIQLETATEIATLPGAMWRTDSPYAPHLTITGIRPWRPARATVVIGLLMAVGLSLAAAAGRVRRRDGPSLRGAALCAGVTGVAITIRVFPLVAFPRLFAASMLVLASFAAEEPLVPAPLGRRIAPAAIAAAIVGALVSAAGGIEWNGALATGGLGALAIAAGIAVHELLASQLVISLLVRSVLAAALIPIWQARQIVLLVPLVPPAPRPLDFAVLTAVLASAAAVSSRRRALV